MKTSWIELHYGWTPIHFIIPLIVFLVLYKMKKKNPVFLAIFILIAFEVFEFFISRVVPLMTGETFVDTIWDVIVGISGVYFGAWWVKRKK